MVEERPEVRQSYYGPDRVSYWLRNFAHLHALAQNPSTSRNLLFRGPTPESPKTGARQKGGHGDHLRYADILADIERAFAMMCLTRPGSLETLTVVKVSEGWPLWRIAKVQQIGKGRTLESFDRACREMAEYLGWVEPPADPD